MFQYELTDCSPDHVVFAFPGPPSSSRVGEVVGWIVMSLVAGGIAFGVWSIVHGTMLWHAHPALMLIGMVLLFFSSGFFFSANAPEDHTITIERASGLVVLRAADGSARVEWPLTECREVAVHETGGTSDSDSGGTSTRFYHLTLKMKDGGEIRLLRTTDATQRDTAAAILEALLTTASPVPAAARTPPALPPSIDVARGPEGTVVRWRSTVQTASFVTLLAVIVSAAILATPLISWTYFPTNNPPDTAGQIIVGVIVGMIAMLIIVAGVRRLRIHGRRHELRITADGVSYDSRGGLSPARVQWSVARERLVAVRFLWVAWMLEFLEGNPDAAAAAIAAGRTPQYDTKHMIRYGRLTVSQMIGIEQFVQAEVERWSGRPVG